MSEDIKVMPFLELNALLATYRYDKERLLRTVANGKSSITKYFQGNDVYARIFMVKNYDLIFSLLGLSPAEKRINMVLKPAKIEYGDLEYIFAQKPET
jgi:hypothetical protein